MDLIEQIMKRWLVYVILASDDTLYTGITTDIVRRWRQHRDGSGGARYFRGRKPRQLVYLECGHDRATASRREAAIKKLTRRQKQALFQAPENCCHHWVQPFSSSF